MSHKSVMNLITDVGKNHDEKVKMWRDSLMSELEVYYFFQNVDCYYF